MYIRKVFERALTETQNWLGTHPKKLLAIAVFTGVAALIWWNQKGLDEAIAKLQWWAALLVAELGLFILIFLVFLIRAPYLIYFDQLKEIDTLSMDLSEVRNSRNANRISPQNLVLIGEFRRCKQGFERIRDRLATGDMGAVDTFYALDFPTSEYIRNNVPGYRDYARSRPITNSYTKKMRYTSERLRPSSKHAKIVKSLLMI